MMLTDVSPQLANPLFKVNIQSKIVNDSHYKASEFKDLVIPNYVSPSESNRFKHVPE